VSEFFCDDNQRGSLQKKIRNLEIHHELSTDPKNIHELHDGERLVLSESLA
jgi:hypothetical protein